MIEMTVKAAHKEGIEVGLCGEMSSEPILAFILLGLELDSLSMPPISILQIKKLIRSVKAKDARKLASEVLGLSTAKDIQEFSKSRLMKLIPDFVKTIQED